MTKSTNFIIGSNFIDQYKNFSHKLVLPQMLSMIRDQRRYHSQYSTVGGGCTYVKWSNLTLYNFGACIYKNLELTFTLAPKNTWIRWKLGIETIKIGRMQGLHDASRYIKDEILSSIKSLTHYLTKAFYMLLSITKFPRTEYMFRRFKLTCAFQCISASQHPTW